MLKGEWGGGGGVGGGGGWGWGGGGGGGGGWMPVFIAHRITVPVFSPPSAPNPKR